MYGYIYRFSVRVFMCVKGSRQLNGLEKIYWWSILILVHIAKAMVLLVLMYQSESWNMNAD